jgi:hypothetical protein
VKHYDDKIIGTTLLTVMGVAMAGFTAWSLVTFSAKLSPEEQKIVSFAPALPKLAVRTALSTAGVNCPIPINQNLAPSQAGLTAPTGFPPGVPPAPDAAPPTISQAIGSAGPTVSFIMIDSSKRAAIINGKIVREGERFEQGTVARIERTRVLVGTGKGEQWLHLK